MTNNAPDYNDNLAFEPEMTWEDLVEWAKEFCKQQKLGASIYPDAFIIQSLTFDRSGDIEQCRVKNRTPRQMQTIIKALYE